MACDEKTERGLYRPSSETRPRLKAVRTSRNFPGPAALSHGGHAAPLQGEQSMRGRLIYVMGASGSGKDSLILEMQRRFRGLPLTAARRYITRPLSPESERHIPVSHERFEHLASSGRFALHWSAHGCRYGISVHSLRALERGVSVLVNGSRAAFDEVSLRYPDLIPVLVTAPLHTLRERLAQRKRESLVEQEERLSSALLPLPANVTGQWMIRIDNSGPLSDAADLLERELHRILFGPADARTEKSSLV